MESPISRSRRVLITWLSGLTGLILGAFSGWWLGAMWSDATPNDPSGPFADLGTVFGSVLLGLILVPLPLVFFVLRMSKAPRPLDSGFVFLISSAAIIGILAWVGTLVLPWNVGIQGGALAVAILGTLGGALVTCRLIR